jgi:hypothetical protein
MSYCRFGEADAYIYDDAYYGIICCACSLLDKGKTEVAEYGDEEPIFYNFVAGYNRQKMLDHIAEHRYVHHYIPLDVDERLKEEIEEDRQKARALTEATQDLLRGEDHVDWCRDLYCGGCYEIKDEDD